MTRNIFLAALSLSLAHGAWAQLRCDAAWTACTQSCLASGPLGSLSSKGSATAQRTRQACVDACYDGKQQCMQREGPPDGPRSGAAEGADKPGTALFMKEMLALHLSQVGIPASKTPGPRPLNPSTLLNAARSLEATEPYEAFKLYQTLARRKDKVGQSAQAALRQWNARQFQDQIRAQNQFTPGVLTSILPSAVLEKIRQMDTVTSFPATAGIVHYEENGTLSQEVHINPMGGGYLYSWSPGRSSVSILGGLIPVVTYESTNNRQTKWQLIDLEISGNPLDFSPGNAFRYVTTEDVSLIASSRMQWQDRYSFVCQVSGDTRVTVVRTENRDKASIVRCERTLLHTTARFEGRPRKIEGERLYIHELRLFSNVKKSQVEGRDAYTNFDGLTGLALSADPLE